MTKARKNKELTLDLIEVRRQTKVQRRGRTRWTIGSYQPKSEEVVEGTKTPTTKMYVGKLQSTVSKIKPEQPEVCGCCDAVRRNRGGNELASGSRR